MLSPDLRYEITQHLTTDQDLKNFQSVWGKLNPESWIRLIREKFGPSFLPLAPEEIYLQLLRKQEMIKSKIKDVHMYFELVRLPLTIQQEIYNLLPDDFVKQYQKHCNEGYGESLYISDENILP